MKAYFENKIVVVTGASSGIGALMARKFADRGAFPVLMARSEQKLAEVASGIRKPHSVRKLDVTSTEQVMLTMEQVLADYGRIDILVNNAGYGLFQPFHEMDMDDFSGMMDVNYLGVVRCIKAVLPSMLKRQEGHIVNIASLAGKIGSAKSGGYSATKHAVLGLTNSLRHELAGTGVCITAVNPGPIDTPFFELADPSGGYVQRVKWMMMKPDQVAQRVLRAVERRSPEVNMPFSAAAAARLYQMFPRMLDRVAMKLLNQK